MSKRKTLQDRAPEGVDIKSLRPGSPILVEWDDTGYEIVLATEKPRNKTDWCVCVLTPRGLDTIDPEQIIKVLGEDFNAVTILNAQEALVQANTIRGFIKFTSDFLDRLSESG